MFEVTDQGRQAMAVIVAKGRKADVARRQAEREAELQASQEERSRRYGHHASPDPALLAAHAALAGAEAHDAMMDSYAGGESSKAHHDLDPAAEQAARHEAINSRRAGELRDPAQSMVPAQRGNARTPPPVPSQAGPASEPAPGPGQQAMVADRFRRPYVEDGRAANSRQAERPHQAPGGVRVQWGSGPVADTLLAGGGRQLQRPDPRPSA